MAGAIGQIFSPSQAWAQENDSGRNPGRAGSGTVRVGKPVPFARTLTLPDGRTLRIPEGFVDKPSTSGGGVVFQHPKAVGRAYQLRVMPPEADPRYPKGYLRYYNKSGQALDASGSAGNPLGEAATHIETDGRPIPGMEGWYRELGKFFGGK